jgi:mediator of RNA polymerase II transcription subunit 23
MLLLSALVDVFGKTAQTTAPVEASQIADLIDFLHHIIHYEGQGGAVQTSSKPRPDILALIGRAAETLRPDVQHLLAHLKTNPNSSIYAAAHQQNTAKTNTS